MKPYELTVLIHPDLEMDLEKSLAKITEVINENGGEIKKQDNWGKKRLAYSIAKENFAVYVYFELDLPSKAPLKLSNAFNINKEILRYLLVKEDAKVKAQKAQNEAKLAKEASEEK